jgi:hypothetical protein
MLNYFCWILFCFIPSFYLRNKSWKPECVLSFNMGWRILVFYPERESQSYWWSIRKNNIVFACFNCTSHNINFGHFDYFQLILYNYCTWTRSIWSFMEQSTTILNEAKPSSICCTLLHTTSYWSSSSVVIVLLHKILFVSYK